MPHLIEQIKRVKYCYAATMLSPNIRVAIEVNGLETVFNAFASVAFCFTLLRTVLIYDYGPQLWVAARKCDRQHGRARGGATAALQRCRRVCAAIYSILEGREARDSFSIPVGPLKF